MGLAEETRLYGLRGSIAEGPARGVGESHRGRVGEEDEGGQEEEEAAETASMGVRKGDR